MGSLGQKKTGPSLHNCAIDWHLDSLDSVDSGPFDAIVMTLVMHFIPDDGAKVAMWKQISKRLKPKGKMVFVNLSRSKDQKQHEAELRAWQEFNIINGIPKEEHQGFFNERLGKLPIVTEERDRELWAEQGFSESFRFTNTLLLKGSLLTKGFE
jgi:tRNA (cmo5U34)-methyltransferase